MVFSENTWSLLIASWNIFKKDKKLLIFSFLGWIITLGAFVLFVLGLIQIFGGVPALKAGGVSERLLFNPFCYGFSPYLAFLLFLLGVNIATNFSMAAIIGCVASRFKREKPTLLTGLKFAFKRLPALLAWAVIISVYRFILGLLGRSRFEKMIVGVADIAFNLLSFFTIPIIIIEGKPVFEALAQSTKMLHETWGKQIVGKFTLGSFFDILALPGVALILLPGNYTPRALIPHGWPVIAGGILYIMFVVALQDTLMAIFQTALYTYVRDKTVPEGFDETLLKGAVEGINSGDRS